ncbi:MAG TPA: CBS domain-containing protein [Rhodocyclaceae bacterium]|nr:CBS domain-containing protein [Rhodocyclaceae bacterium]
MPIGQFQRDISECPVSTALLHQYFGEQAQHGGYQVVHGDRLIGMLEYDMLLGRSRSDHWVLPDVTGRQAAGRMADLHVDHLSVIEDADSMRLIGIVSASDLLRPSHHNLHEETVREKLRRRICRRHTGVFVIACRYYREFISRIFREMSSSQASVRSCGEYR